MPRRLTQQRGDWMPLNLTTRLAVRAAKTLNAQRARATIAR